MEKFRWCFIGTGSLAHHVAGEILKTGRHEIVTAYSRRMESCRAFADAFGSAACRTAQEAIENPNVDGVYVVTPHMSHYEYARLALELGKPVLCEKAFTITAAQTDELIALAAEKKRYLCEAMWTWFGTSAYQTKAWIDSGMIGTPQTARMTFRLKKGAYAPRVADPMLGGGALLDIGVYPITYLYRLFGYPTDIRCAGRVSDGLDWGEEIALTFANGLTAEISTAIDDDAYSQSMSICGSEGEITARCFHSEPDLCLLRAGRHVQDFHGECGYVREFDTVAAEIRAGKLESDWVPLSATADVMRMMDVCCQQMGLTYDCGQK